MSLYAKLAAAILIMLVLAGMYHKGRVDGTKIERSTWQAKEIDRKDAEFAAIVTAQRENLRIQNQHDADNMKASQDHENAIKALNAKVVSLNADLTARGGMRVSRTICNQPAVSAGSKDTSADLAGTVELPPELSQFLLSEADRADQIVEGERDFHVRMRIAGCAD